MKQGPLPGASACGTSGEVTPEGSQLPPLLQAGRDAWRGSGTRVVVHVGAPAGAKTAVSSGTRVIFRTAGFAAAAAPTGGPGRVAGLRDAWWFM